MTDTHFFEINDKALAGIGLKGLTEIRIAERHMIADHRHIQRTRIMLLNISQRGFHIGMLGMCRTYSYNIIVHTEQ
ncbi:hypothetical protein D3C80_2152300 [compost metagenome]